ncbi:MAG: DUF4336 domain-containing protein, partial [Hyphomicrobiales bacterium]|nr:DUF4336 domain-containing protein [Hyphomicrobiales bacterium]
MTIIRLRSGKLFVHSPISPESELMNQTRALGEVEFIVSPNKIHHLYMGDWKELYPQAKIYASPGLKQRRKDLEFFSVLGDVADQGWAEEIDQHVFAGSWAMQEVLFFHKETRTLILADLIENFDKDWFSGWKRRVANLIGIVEPDGRAPLDYRMSFLGRKSMARASVERIRAWRPKNIIIAHGACYKGDGKKELE